MGTTAPVPLVAGWRTMAVKRRTDQVAAAIAAELEVQRNTLNMTPNVRTVTVVVRFKQGTETPRSVSLTVESERTLGEEGKSG